MNDDSKYAYIIFNKDCGTIGYTYSKKVIKSYLKYNPEDEAIRVKHGKIDMLDCPPLHEYVTPEGKVYGLTDIQDEYMRQIFSPHITHLANSISLIIKSLPAIDIEKKELGEMYESLSILNDLRFDISVGDRPSMDLFDDSLLAEFYCMRVLAGMSHEKYITKKMQNLKGNRK